VRFSKKPPTRREHVLGNEVVDEHFVPQPGLTLADYARRGDLIGAHHLVRYLWAAEYLRRLQPRRVLDLGCGSGYGSSLLAGVLPGSSVRGADHDAKAIGEARRAYGGSGASFDVGDPLEWDATIGGASFDVVVCFDVLEHVEHREVLLEALVRHLDDDGLLLLSTPCCRATNDLKPGWRFHRIEYAAASLYDLLRRYFGDVLGSDRDDFPNKDVFAGLHAMGVEYALLMNPVICRGPIRVENPYRRG
jgi:SAM-dependent methyltransferase